MSVYGGGGRKEICAEEGSNPRIDLRANSWFLGSLRDRSSSTLSLPSACFIRSFRMRRVLRVLWRFNYDLNRCLHRLFETPIDTQRHFLALSLSTPNTYHHGKSSESIYGCIYGIYESNHLKKYINLTLIIIFFSYVIIYSFGNVYRSFQGFYSNLAIAFFDF